MYWKKKMKYRSIEFSDPTLIEEESDIEILFATLGDLAIHYSGDGEIVMPIYRIEQDTN
jgi:hypothetical protein